MNVKLLGPSSLRTRRGVVTRGSVGEAVWFTVCRVQAEETRVSDHNAQEGIENLSDRLLLHLPLSTGSSLAGAEGGAAVGSSVTLSGHVCLWNAAEIRVFLGLARKGSGYLLVYQRRGSPSG